MAALHHWTRPEDIVAFFLSRWGDRSFLGIETATILRLLNERPLPDGSRAVPIPAGSLLRRIQNFNYLDGKPGCLIMPNSAAMYTKNTRTSPLLNYVYWSFRYLVSP